ncbi:hypothetical protein Acsp07_57780 [Actinomycetospora sp. NBRC 106378]|nr:hypothetical protein Acsp07_57780 [Actinomycetospora sp. NBRC 106378]
MIRMAGLVASPAPSLEPSGHTNRIGIRRTAARNSERAMTIRTRFSPGSCSPGQTPSAGRGTRRVLRTGVRSGTGMVDDTAVVLSTLGSQRATELPSAAPSRPTARSFGLMWW